MPIDPMIARGVEPLTFGNTLMQISALKQRDRSLDQDAQYQNALMQDRQQARTDQQAMRTADDEEDAQWEAAIQAGDLDGAFRIDPQATSLYANWKKSQEPGGQDIKVGQYNPGDYTPQSWAQFLQSKDPAGLQRQYAPPAPPQPILINTPAYGAGLVDRRTGQPITQFTTPQEEQAAIGDRRAAQETGLQRAKSEADLPRVQANAADMRNVLGQLKSAEGLRYVFGAYSLAPIVPGTPQADAHAIWEQVQGKAFLEAFNTLKGGGQITEKEGEKATAAITRLSNRRQSLGGAMKAIKDLEDVVTSAEQRAKQKTASGEGATRRRFNPETGKIE
jgi:hypothetical protein